MMSREIGTDEQLVIDIYWHNTCLFDTLSQWKKQSVA